MKAFLEYVHYDGNITHRGRIPMPDVSPEDFVVGIDCATVFQYPVSDVPVNPMLYVWKSCQPEDDEETKKLFALGKYVDPGVPQKEPS